MLRKCTGRKLGPYVTALKDKRVRGRVWQETMECDHVHMVNAGISGAGELLQEWMFI